MYIQLTSNDNHTLNAYVTGPENAQYGLVVAQEIFGVNSHIRQVADYFASQGYRVICPALFDRAQADVELGYATADIQTGLALRDQIPIAKTLLDLDAAAQALQAQSSIGIVGYCWGGTLAWLAASRSNAFTAASCWYGGSIVKTKDEIPSIPVQMHFGSLDAAIPPHDVAAIQDAQPSVEIHNYPGADHGFGCNQRSSFNEQAWTLANERTLQFFAQHLA